MSRSHRIGQVKPVKVYRLLAAKTYEMHMFQVASLKLGLGNAVQGSHGASVGAGAGGESLAGAGSALSKKAVEDLLKRGTVALTMSLLLFTRKISLLIILRRVLDL